MKRRISLYIGERLVDLDEDSLVLFNYAMEDLTNPTIVKNSFSHQITLKGTANNNKVFGDIFRTDRIVSFTGSDFNPSRKTPFTIYNEAGEVLESGYCKLESVTKKEGTIEYKVSLFGGLGSFLYGLSYDDEGNKRTLASLDYLGTDNTETELDFAINAGSVQDAWDTDLSDTSVDSKWKVINFSPAYNGIPEGNFSADKAVVNPALVGLQSTIGGYSTKEGVALVNFAKAHDEWAVKDLRSYFQRPVFSMNAFLAAIRESRNNGGWVVNMPFLNKQSFLLYSRLWMTLPMIPSLGSMRKRSEDYSLNLVSIPTTANPMGRVSVVGDVPFGAKVNTTLNVKLAYQFGKGVTADSLSTSYFENFGFATRGVHTVIFVQVVAHASDDTIMGGSKVKSLLLANIPLSPSELAAKCKYVPHFSLGEDTFEADYTKVGVFNKSGISYVLDHDLGFVVETLDAAYYEVVVNTYTIDTYLPPFFKTPDVYASGSGTPLAVFPLGLHSSVTATGGNIIQGAVGNTISVESDSNLRSGAVITKQMLLSTKETPADYLLSFCKLFGLHMLCDKAEKVITIVDRNDLYNDEVVDLTERVDLSKDISITPYVFNSKWYDFLLQSVGGAFSDEYQSIHGRIYGQQRINTGYEFNAEAVNLLEGNVFKNAVTILDKSPYYTILKQSGQFRPSVFLDKENTYSLFDSEGKTLETEISLPMDTISVQYMNDYGHPGYDMEFARKMEFRSADNKPVDGAGVLLFLESWNTYDYFNLSDDTAAMDLVNDGVPCWQLNPGTELTIPCFSRYFYAREWRVGDSLDFGVPAELDIPAVTYPEDTTIYARCWRNYLRDRYDVNTKVMTCKVNLAGLRIDQSLLRRFYYYGNSLWVLNRVKNYSLTTYDPTECEFVQVQDKDNYLNGQE